MWKSLLLLCVALTAGAEDGLPRNTSPPNAEVYIIAPADGAKLKSPVTVRFGLRGMGVAPAGINMVGTGHHHLLIDVETLPALDKPLPKDDQHLHFGAGQTEASVELAPGEHTLQLVLGDQLHIPHQPPVVSEKITITIER
jgi:hypothetical protein